MLAGCERLLRSLSSRSVAVGAIGLLSRELALVSLAHLESLTSRSGVKQFPITERDRELDQLRYLVATSATPDADQRRAGDGASAYASMIAPRDAPR
jgi:hypothetical protein